MEGLIPLVCRSIKRTRTRLHYEFLSFDDTFINIQDFYETEAESTTTEGNRHRRHKSLYVEQSGGFSSDRGDAHKPEKLVRFRSHKMFSCVTGA